MNTKEKEIQKALGTYLPCAWNEYVQQTNRAEKINLKGKRIEKLIPDEGKWTFQEERVWDYAQKLYKQSHELAVDAAKQFEFAAKYVYGANAYVEFEVNTYLGSLIHNSVKIQPNGYEDVFSLITFKR
jgi:hypothetical protein